MPREYDRGYHDALAEPLPCSAVWLHQRAGLANGRSQRARLSGPSLGASRCPALTGGVFCVRPRYDGRREDSAAIFLRRKT